VREVAKQEVSAHPGRATPTLLGSRPANPAAPRNVGALSRGAHIFAVVLMAVAACSSAPSNTVQLKNGATGHVIANCRSTDECEARSKKKCGPGYGVHEKHEERREVSTGAGLYPVMGMTATKKEIFWKYVVECDPPAPVQTVMLDDALSRMEQELYDSREQAVAVSTAISKRRYIDAVCSLRPGPMRDEEIEIARRQFGDFSCR